jgi:hypothetical protein
MHSETRKEVVSAMEAGRENVYRVPKMETHDISPMVNLVSLKPTLSCLARRTSVSLGIYPGDPIRRTSSRKLQKGVSAIEAGTTLKNTLCGRIHEVKIARVLVHDFGNSWILP